MATPDVKFKGPPVPVWIFFLFLLGSPKHEPVVNWVNKEEKLFRINDRRQNELARLWSGRKGTGKAKQIGFDNMM